MPAKLTLLSVATPLASVVAVPTDELLMVKVMVLPLRAEPSPFQVSFACRVVVPP